MSTIKKIWNMIIEETPDDPEATFYRNMLIEEAKNISDPKYDKASVERRFYDILNSISWTEQFHAFKIRISFGLRLAAETTLPEPRRQNYELKEHINPLEVIN